MVPQLIRRIYASELMVKESLVMGELPSTKTAYIIGMTTAWASIAESFLIALISMVDTMMVGVVGPHAIAAVGLVTQPRFIVLTLVMSLNMAVTSITARRKGENDPDGAVRCLKQALVLSLGMSILVSLLAYQARSPLLRFAGAQPDTLEMSTEYFEIILLGTPISALSMTISAGQRGIGETKASMIINMSTNVVSLIFNCLLIGGNLGFPALGVRGAAIATVIGWFCGLLVSIASVSHKDRFLFLFTRQDWRLDKAVLSSIYKVASGSFLEQICTRMGFLAYSKIIAGLGTIVFAAHQIYINILSLSFSFGEGFGIAASSLVGQNLGAKRPDLSIVYGKVCQRMSYITSVGVFFLFAFAGRFMVGLFSNDSRILDMSAPILIIMGIVVFGQASQMILMGSLRGAGDTRYTAVVCLICIMLVRPVLAYLLAYPAGLALVGAWLAFIVDQYLRLLLTVRRFSSGGWMSIKL